MNKQAIDFLSRLVAAKSTSSKSPAFDMSNKKAAETVADMLETAGMLVEMIEVPGLSDKHNIIAKAGPDMPGEGLLLAGHTDTVPCNEDEWETDPFTLTEKDGCLHGLGSCDMKGFFAAVHAALCNVDFGKLQKPLHVWATAEEECGMEGAVNLAKVATPCAAALLGEPTKVTPVIGHKGAFADKIICHGKSGHASMPDAGANSLEAIGRVMAALREDNDKHASENANDRFAPPRPTINFGFARAGDAFNKIPDRAELWVDRRILPNEKLTEVRQRTRSVAKEAAEQEDGIRIEFEVIVEGFGAILTAEDAPIVAEAERITGKKATTVSFGTEAPYYADAGMDVLIMGAGDIAHAHMPNERVSIAALSEMADATRKLIGVFCEESK